jgi:hypothetical protein
MRTTALLALVLLNACALRSSQPAPPATVPQAACLHGSDETAAERARRRDAVQLVRAINTGQARSRAAEQSYRRLIDLPNLPAAPVGFVVQMAAERDSYVVAMKDTTDPCGFALFSDHAGLIYSGTPLR